MPIGRDYRTVPGGARLLTRLLLAFHDLSPADQAPVLLDAPRQGDLVAFRGADWRHENDFGEIPLAVLAHLAAIVSQ